MQNLNVGVLQLDQVWHDKQANFERIEQWLSNKPELDLLLLPEMFHTGFSMDVKLADNWSNSEGLHFLQKLSHRLDTAIYTSLMVSDGSFYYNRGVFVQPSGQLHIYDKRKLFGLGGEEGLFTAGRHEQILEFKGWKINLQICYDLRFPELIRNRVNTLNEAAYDVLLYVANWPDRRITHWDSLLGARAIENQCFVVACNRVGTDMNNLDYCGHSQMIDMLGKKILEPTAQEGIFMATLDAKLLKEARKQLPFLKDA